MIANSQSANGWRSERCAIHFILWLSIVSECVILVSQGRSNNEYSLANLIPNSSFECGSVGWQSYLPRVGIVSSPHRLHGEVIEAGDAPHGRMVLRLDGNAVRSTLKLLRAHAPVVNPLVAPAGWVKLCSGKTYTFSAFMRSDYDATATVMVRYPSGSRQERQFRLSSSWRRYSFTFVALNEFALVAIGPCCAAQEDVGSIFVDAVQLECGATPSAYKPRAQLEFFVTSNSPANVWMNASHADMHIVGYNDGADVEAAFDVQVSDFKGAVISHHKLNAKILMAGKFAIPLKHVLPRAFGFYRVSVRAYDSAGQLIGSTETRCALLRKFDGVDSSFGAEDVHACDELLLLAKRAGLLWRKIRVGSFSAVESGSGDFEVAAKVDLALKFGMHPLLSISTSQLTGTLSGACGAGDEESIADELLELSQGANTDKLALLIGAEVKRYRTRVMAFELMHDKPLHAVCSQEHDLQLSKYIGLLKATYGLAKSICRDCVFLGGVSVDDAETAFKVAREFIASGGLGFVDALAVEICPAQAQPEAIEQLMRNLLSQVDAHGRRKPIWVTLRWSFTSEDDDAQPTGASQSECEMGIRMVRLAAILLSHGVSKVFHACGREPSDEHLGDLFFDFSGMPCVALPMHAALASILTSSPISLGALNFGSRSRCYAFLTPNGIVAIAWLAEEDTSVYLSLGRTVKAYDIMGNDIAATRVRLSTMPIYLSSKARDLRSFAAAVRPQADKSQ